MRKTILFCFVLITATLLCTASFAAEDRVGFIDAQRALVAHPKYEQSQKQLNDFVEKTTNEAKKLAETKQNEQERLAVIENARWACGDEEMRVMNPITADINGIIEKVAKTKGVTVVLNKMLIYFGGVDITEDVVKGLKELKF